MDSQPESTFATSKQKRLENLLKKKAQILQNSINAAYSNPDQLKSAEDYSENIQKTFKTSLIQSETWIYLIFPSFQVSIEQRDDPSLAQVPLATCINNTLTSLNNLSISLGLQLSMTNYQAYKLSKDLIILQENPEKYRTECLKIKNIIKNYDSQFQEQGLDQFAICVTQILKRKCMDTDAGKEALAKEIKRKIFEETQLECSVGIACNRLLAHACSLISKPNGQFYLRPENGKNFLTSLEVCNNPLVSENEAIILSYLGISSCGQILDKKTELFIAFPEKTFKRLIKAALGLGITSSQSQGQKKNLFSSRLIFEQTNIEEFLEEKLKELTETLGNELRKNKLKGKGIDLLIKNASYETRKKREEVKSFYSNGKDLFEFAVILLRMFYPVEPIRSIGLKLWNLKQIPENAPIIQGKLKKVPKSTEDFTDMFINKSMMPCLPSKFSLNNSLTKQ
jgi:nucleotidyltransferase/DNA polymerase involved in DNA repair